jgi:glycopeptide antibiotics resistance protein
MGKILSRGLLVLYLVTLTWMVLFKLTFNISRVLNYHHRSLNLVPFGASKIVNGRIDFEEIILNCVFFIPFGLLLNVNFKKAGFLPRLTCILVYSVAAESIQYIFAIGATDITDVISNTAGGFLGLILYDLSNKYIKTEKLDRIIISTGMLLFVWPCPCRSVISF